jgi:antitoxin ParD1/3/4
MIDCRVASCGGRSQSSFAKLCQAHYDGSMSTMNISLPEALKSFVDEQVNSRGFGTSSEYVRELIRKDQERLHLRELLLAGASAKPAAAADGAYFAALRDRIGSRSAA